MAGDAMYVLAWLDLPSDCLCRTRARLTPFLHVLPPPSSFLPPRPGTRANKRGEGRGVIYSRRVTSIIGGTESATGAAILDLLLRKKHFLCKERVLSAERAKDRGPCFLIRRQFPC